MVSISKISIGQSVAGMMMRHDVKNVVLILAPGESQRPKRLRCVNSYCGRTMMTVNREVALTLEDNKGIHWADVPDDVTVVEHKCRGCNYCYRIYTPETPKAKAELNTMIQAGNVV